MLLRIAHSDNKQKRDKDVFVRHRRRGSDTPGFFGKWHVRFLSVLYFDRSIIFLFLSFEAPFRTTWVSELEQKIAFRAVCARPRKPITLTLII